MAGRASGTGDRLRFATGLLEVSDKRPAAIDREVLLEARITEARENKSTLQCTLLSAGEICAESKVIAVRVPGDWVG